MANPRQRRKARSSSHKPVSHSRHARRNLKKTPRMSSNEFVDELLNWWSWPAIRGPKVLQDAWDNQKTVRQKWEVSTLPLRHLSSASCLFFPCFLGSSYAQLGLVVTLDPSARGGVERPLGVGTSIEIPREQSSDSAFSNVPNGFGRLVRDAAGNVTGFELDDDGGDMQEPYEPVNLEDDLESRLDQAVRLKWASGFSSTTPKIDGNVVNREFSFVLSSYGFMHFTCSFIKHFWGLHSKLMPGIRWASQFCIAIQSHLPTFS